MPEGDYVRTPARPDNRLLVRYPVPASHLPAGRTGGEERNGEQNTDRKSKTKVGVPMNEHGRKSTAVAVCLSLFAGAGVLSSVPAQGQTGVPRPDHVVIVIEENHSYDEIIGSTKAPYINSLAQQGALFTASFA